MLQIDNRTPFATSIGLLPDRQGVDTLFVVVKGTFTLAPALVVAEQQVAVAMADEHWGDPGESSVKVASELHLGKPGTDVVLVGQAWAPRRVAVPENGVTLAVADRQKSLAVVGDRVWAGSTPSSPRPFVSIPLMYERAYGGSYRVGTRLFCEERNPVGRGFLGARSKSELASQPVPNIEDPRRRLRSLGDVVPAVGFGFIAPSWQARRQYAGTYDEAWQKTRAPYLPDDFDPRYFHAAPVDQIFPQPLQGGEPVLVAGAAPEGTMRFKLPQCRFRVSATIAGKGHDPAPPALETVLIEPDDNRVCLSWRFRIPCDKQPLKVQMIRIGLDQMTLDRRPVR